MSISLIQIILIIIHLHKAKEENHSINKLRDDIIIIRNSPYPPIFNIIAASTMDPNVGDSTWALGNQKCNKYIGNFTKKAINLLKIKILILNEENNLKIIINCQLIKTKYFNINNK